MHPSPPRWRYDVLRALDYFRDCSAPRDRHLADGIENLKRKQMKDQNWRLNTGMTGLKYFAMSATVNPAG